MSKEIEYIDAALESAGQRLAQDITGLAQLIIDKVGRPPSAIERGAFGLKVIWKEGAIVDVKPDGVYQLRGTDLWMDEDEVAKRVIERLDHPKPTLVSFERQIKDVCDQMAQAMRKIGVALLKEFFETGQVEQVSGDREALILTLRDKGQRRLDVKINAHGQVAVVREGSKELDFTESMTTAVKMIHHLLEIRSLLPPGEDKKKALRIPDALDVKMAISNLEGLSEQHPKRQIEEVQEEEPKKSPKIEEEPVPPTQLVNLE